jgi:hypothetical protein
MRWALFLVLSAAVLAGLPERVVLVILTETQIVTDDETGSVVTNVVDVYQTVPDLPAYRYSSSRTRSAGETENQAHEAIRAEVAGWCARMGRDIGPVEVLP